MRSCGLLNQIINIGKHTEIARKTYNLPNVSAVRHGNRMQTCSLPKENVYYFRVYMPGYYPVVYGTDYDCGERKNLSTMLDR